MTVRWGEGQGMVMKGLMDGTLDVLLVPMDPQVNESISVSPYPNKLINVAHIIFSIRCITRQLEGKIFMWDYWKKSSGLGFTNENSLLYGSFSPLPFQGLFRKIKDT